MTVKTYSHLIDEMKELADKINKHYDTVTLETVEELDTPETETQRILNELKDKGVLTEEDSGYKISGDWEKLGITNDGEEAPQPDKDFPSGTVWSVGRGGPKSEMFYFTSQNTGTHFATIVDIGDGTWQVELANGEVVTDPPPPYKKWAEAEAVVKTVYDEQTVDEGHKKMPSIDRNRYDEIPGLEGPFMTLSGKVVYYDPKEGKYYDRDSDIYLDYDEWKKYDSEPDWASKEED